MNDGVVDANMVKPNMTFPGRNSSNLNNQVNAQRPSKPPRKYTPLGELIETRFKKLVANKIITILYNPPYEPNMKHACWNDDGFCEYN